MIELGGDGHEGLCNAADWPASGDEIAFGAYQKSSCPFVFCSAASARNGGCANLRGRNCSAVRGRECVPCLQGIV